MKRKMTEILASQKEMLEKKGQDISHANDEQMAKLFSNHLEEIKNWLAKQSNIDVLYVSYNDVIKNPEANIEKVNQFLGNKLDVKKMVGAIDKSLYRQRK